jgi:hypothetical protein
VKEIKKEKHYLLERTSTTLNEKIAVKVIRLEKCPSNSGKPTNFGLPYFMEMLTMFAHLEVEVKSIELDHQPQHVI